ncbi:hypothetical protein BKA70DRAFT_1430285 [Coprinopsis sp. MPI-PUGE-AT-0042]|nr:hypothetical protein BKA70DRAFT_1430285 [Coprinopsis sp. MPI-PUGE-AT-0042]
MPTKDFASVELEPTYESWPSSSYPELRRFHRYRKLLSRNMRLGSYVRELQLTYVVALESTRRSTGEEEYDTLRLLDNVRKLTLGFTRFSVGSPVSWLDDAFQRLRKETVSFAQRNPVE